MTRPGSRARLLLVALAALALVQCGRNPAEERALRAYERKEGEIRIGVVWPFASRNDGFRDGVRLAIEHVNASGGVQGRPLAPVYEDDGDRAERALAIARRLGEDPDVVAVIGHFSAEVSLPASLLYHQAGILYLSTGTTEPDLTMHKFPMVLSLMPSDHGFGAAVARLPSEPGFDTIRRIVILNSDDKDGRSFATGISYAISNSGVPLQILGQFSFRGTEASFVSLLARIAEIPADAVVVSCPEPPAGRLITQARDMGISARFIGSPKLDTLRLWDSAGEHAEGTMVMSVYTPYARDTAAREFRDAFLRRYGADPDAWAAVGYDAVRAMASAMASSNSTVPALVADMMRSNMALPGATGILSFDDYGLRESCPIQYKVLREGTFLYPQM